MTLASPRVVLLSPRGLVPAWSSSAWAPDTGEAERP
jgi:hypothetical protein